MEIETLKRSHLKRNILIGIVIVLITSAIIFEFTKAKYRVTESIPLVNGTINYNLADLNIVAISVDGKPSDTIPEGNYELIEDSYCTVNGKENTTITLSYDADTQTSTVLPFTTKGTKCYLDFAKKLSAIETIEKLYSNNQNILAYDDYNNLRYIGSNPNNYVSFNNELWRIIGVFSEDTHGLSGQKLIKIIRSKSLENIAWNDNNLNNWPTASLQTTLNGDYLKGTGSYTSTGIKNDTARNMIETVIWKLGGAKSWSNASNGLARHFYGYERGTAVYEANSTTWNGKIALMYPSDYGYATSGGSSTKRASCLAKEITGWSDSGYIECANNNWLYDNSDNQWTLTTSTSYYFDVIIIYRIAYQAHLSVYNADRLESVRPSLYLKSSVSITGGDGSSSNPYTLELN